MKYRYSFSFNNKTHKELFFCEPIIGWQVRKDVISAVNNFTRSIVLMEQLFKITFDGASALEYEEDEGWVCRDSITHAIIHRVVIHSQSITAKQSNPRHAQWTRQCHGCSWSDFYKWERCTKCQDLCSYFVARWRMMIKTTCVSEILQLFLFTEEQCSKFANLFLWWQVVVNCVIGAIF